MKNIQKTVWNINTPGAYDWDTENENDINLSLRDDQILRNILRM